MKLTITVTSQSFNVLRTAVCQAYIAVGELEASGEKKKVVKKLKCCSEKCGVMEFEP